MKAVLVFIDGTICDTRHRHHLFDLPQFHEEEEIMKDSPTPNSVECLRELSERYEIVYISARSDSLKDITRKWLDKVGFLRGEIYLAEDQQDGLDMVKDLRRQYNFIAGIGDRWDDNELHLEIGCLSIILQEFEGNWDTVRKYLLDL